MFQIDETKSDSWNLGEALKEIGILWEILVDERARHIDVSCKYDDMEGRCSFGETGWCKGCKQKDRMLNLAREQLEAERAQKEAEQS